MIMEQNQQYEIKLRWSAGVGIRIYAAGLSADIQVAVPIESAGRE